MKKLILLRHAKSSWDDSFIKDHDRVLSEKGLNDAPVIGKFLYKKNLIPDLILSSTAKRASMTTELVSNELNKEIRIKYDNNLYLAGPGKIIEIISKTNNEINTVMVVGHNPDMEMLVERITKTHLPHSKFSTAGTAVIDFEIESWNEIKTTIGKLEIFVTPKMLAS